MKKTIVILLVLLIAGSLGGWYWINRKDNASTFRMATVERGDLLSTISATGTVEPEEVVDVGAQVAGKINAFGVDPHDPGKVIDYRTQVEEGTVLAEIDTTLYQSELEQALAQLESAKAAVTKAQADLGQMKAKLSQAEADWKRVAQAGTAAGLSQSDVDTYRANYEVAKANLLVGDASVAQVQANVKQIEATVKRATTNLGYCTIKSPVKGVIIDRRVNIGQTVVASLSAPSLFLIAKDLKRLQVWASVNEADIGHIQPGQPVTFTVDAYPGRSFKGSVGKVRLNASMTQNVVTYTIEVVTDNPDGKLLPYMTANLQFELDRREGVLTVPNAALRWVPQESQMSPESKQAYTEILSKIASKNRPATRSTTGMQSRSTQRDRGVLWLADGPLVKPLSVKIGLGDGSLTEIEAEGLIEGTEIILGDAQTGNKNAGTVNPFTPKMPSGRR